MAHQLETDLPKWAAPVLTELDLTIYDIEVAAGKVRLVVTRPGGVGLDEIARCTRGISAIMDERDPISGTYTLEVSSPGLERKLRTVDHRRDAIGERVKCKFRDADGATRRVEGELRDVTDNALVIEAESGEQQVDHDQIVSVHTVFIWPDSASKPRAKAPHNARKAKP